MYTIRNVSSKNEFESIYTLIQKNLVRSGLEEPQLHIGNLVFDQHICCEQEVDFKQLMSLIHYESSCIGFLILEDESFFIYLDKPYENHLRAFIELVEYTYFEVGKTINTSENVSFEDVVELLKSRGYIADTYYRYNGLCNLGHLTGKSELPEGYLIRPTREADSEPILKLIGYAIKGDVTIDKYEALRSDSRFKEALELVVENTEGEVVSYAMFWRDKPSKTAVLEPVACMENYRNKGLTKALLLYGMKQLESEGIKAVYVSTSGTNTSSQALYSSVGFVNFGWEFEYIKTL
jgi:predicted N-acetyltransferase YhbS